MADRNTLSGQEPEPQNQNPYRDVVLPSGQSPIPPSADPKRTRFSAAAITGMVLVTIVWAIVIGPLISWAIWDVSGFSIIELFVFSGLLVLPGGVAGFIVALIKGNKKRAARLYIIPSLIWQGVTFVAALLIVLALAGYL